MVTLALALALTAPAFATGSSGLLEERVKEKTLKNGLKILVVPRSGSPTFSAFVRFKVGSVDEQTGETGIAHILEHMLFKGTSHIGTTDYRAEAAIMAEVEDIGSKLDAERRKGSSADVLMIEELKNKLEAKLAEQRKFIVKDELNSIYSRNGGASFNAFTGQDTTTYIVKLPANKLELWAWLESDRMRTPVLREYYSERDVVMEERRRSVENDPGGALYERFLATAFMAHPYGIPIIGWASDIALLPKEKVTRFLKTYYSPNNMVVCIAGDVNPDEVFRVLEKYFGDIPAQTIPPRLATTEPEQKGERRIEVEFDASPQLLIGWHKPAMPHRDDYVFDLITAILTEGRTSRLHRSLVIEKQLAASVSAWTGPGSRYDNLLMVSIVPRAPHTGAEVEKALYAEIDKLKKVPVTAHEIQKILNNIEAGFVRGLASNSGLAYHLSNYQVLTGDWRYLTNYGDIIRTVTPEEIMEVTKKYLVKGNRTVATLVRPAAEKVQ